MKKITTVFLLIFSFFSVAQSQILNPIAVTGFNHDIVAEGTENSSLSTTTLEMDAVSISNYVMCTKEFADANGFTPANIYGLPTVACLRPTHETTGWPLLRATMCCIFFPPIPAIWF